MKSNTFETDYSLIDSGFIIKDSTIVVHYDDDTELKVKLFDAITKVKSDYIESLDDNDDVDLDNLIVRCEF